MVELLVPKPDDEGSIPFTRSIAPSISFPYPQRTLPLGERIQERAHPRGQELATGIHGEDGNLCRRPARQQAHQVAPGQGLLAVTGLDQTNPKSAQDQRAHRAVSE